MDLFLINYILNYTQYNNSEGVLVWIMKISMNCF